MRFDRYRLRVDTVPTKTAFSVYPRFLIAAYSAPLELEDFIGSGFYKYRRS